MMLDYSFFLFLLFFSFTQPCNGLVLGLTHYKDSHEPMARPLRPFSTTDLSEPVRGYRDGYLFSLSLGTPPQLMQVYMDTGSDLTWVPCGNLSFECINCKDNRGDRVMGSFSPSLSSSCSRDVCDSHFCVTIHSSDDSYDPCAMTGCFLGSILRGMCSRPCPPFTYTYGDGIVLGTLTRDTLMVHGSDQSVTKDVPDFCFGCVASTYMEPIGIVGFGKGALSLPSQLGFLHKGFSHCFLSFKFSNKPNISTPLIIGDSAIASREEVQFTPMLKCPMYPSFYYVGLEAIFIGGEILEVPQILREINSQGNGGMLVDSGTTYTHLPQALFTKFLSVMGSKITHPRSVEHERKTGFGLCYQVPTAVTESLPSLSFRFVNNVTLTLPEENYFYAMAPSNGTYIVKCLLVQGMEDDSYGPAGVLGSFQQQNVEVVYDLSDERIGFHARDCALLAISHGLHKK
ncbi:hypothetical protein AMTRI_Chr02g255570 [Amborella trichopoda]